MTTMQAARRPWQDDMTWSRQFLFNMSAICGAYLIRESPWEEDAHRNTDLIVLSVPSGLRVACRVRQAHYLLKWPDEFTIRCSRGSGVETELSKLLAGWGDYILYGFADDASPRPRLKAWVLGDLSVFRSWYSAYVDTHGREPCRVRRNGDGSSDFLACRIDELPPEFVVARQFPDGRRLA
ncbi:MAG: hypothetical protein LC798_19845 [Chloroflexi bacterium]|nr:hypothetical protein [Chloroflexota bacterium]